MPSAILTNGFKLDSGREGKGASRPVSRVLSMTVARHWMTIHLERPSPDASRDLPGWLGRKHPWARRPAPSLFGLAPGGVCPAAAVAGSAVRSCRTISPLRRGKPRSRYNFCGTFPGVAPAGRYPAPCFHGARTFLHRALSGLAAAVIRPAGRGEVGAAGPKVKWWFAPGWRGSEIFKHASSSCFGSGRSRELEARSPKPTGPPLDPPPKPLSRPGPRRGRTLGL